MSVPVNVLVVGGGGSAGKGPGSGGGGGGDVQSNTAYLIDPGSIAVTVGLGGIVPGVNTVHGNPGTNSVFGLITAFGGNGGGSTQAPVSAANTGSGGGGAGGGAGANTGTVGHGHKGGNTSPGGTQAGGGGAGADAPDNPSSAPNAGGAGGLGISSSISGVLVFYGTGGGGGGSGTNSINGGIGGAGDPEGGGHGGSGAAPGVAATPGTPGRGTGGGGGGYNAGVGGNLGTLGANGGDGSVTISYATGTLLATGGVITVVGGNTIHTFTTNGTFTVMASITLDGTLTPVGALGKAISVQHSGSLSQTSNAALLLSRIPASVTEGDTYEGFVVASSAPDAEPWTYDISAGALPPGITLDANTGLVTGATPVPTRATYTFTIRATHSGYSQSRQFSIVVGPRKKLQLPHIVKANTGPDLITHTARAEDALSANVPDTLLSTDPTIGDVPISVPWANLAQKAAYAVLANTATFWRGLSEFQAGTNVTFTPNGQAIVISSTGGGGGGGNAYGTIGVSGQANLVAASANSLLTVVAGLGIILTTNVGSDGALHFAVNATPLNVNSALTANDTTHAFGKLEAGLNVNNATTAYGKTEGNLNVNSAATALVANDTSHAFGKLEGALNVNSATSSLTTNIANFLAVNGVLLGNSIANGTFFANGNTTINGTANVVSTLAAGNTTITGFLNVSSTLNVAGNVQVANLIVFGAGFGAPTFTTRSAGQKVVIFPAVDATHVDYGIGVEAGGLWFSAANSQAFFNWYGGTTINMTLAAGGALSWGGGVSVANSSVIPLLSANNIFTGNNVFNSGDFLLGNGVSNFLRFQGAGFGLPTTVTRSVGTKIVLFSSVGAADIDYALGIAAGVLWYSSGGTDHKWYHGNDILDMQLSSGVFTTFGNNALGGNTTVNGSLTVNGTVAFNSTVSANGDVGTATYVLTSGGPGANAYWAAAGGPGGSTNSYGTIEAAGVANLVAATTNAVFTFVAGNGVLFTSNVASDGAFHIAVNGAQQIGNTTITGFANISSTLVVAGLVTANAGLVVNGTVQFNNTVTANGDVGTALWVLTSGGAGANAYWAPVSAPSSTTNSYGTIEVAGQANLVAATGNSILTLVAGSGITLTTNVASDGAVHIAASGGFALHDDGNSGTAKTIDWSLGSEHYLTLTGNCTLTLSNPVDGGRYVLVVNSGAGAFTLTWPAAVSWPDSRTPIVSQFASKVDIYTLLYSTTLSKYIGSYNQNYG